MEKNGWRKWIKSWPCACFGLLCLSACEAETSSQWRFVSLKDTASIAFLDGKIRESRGSAGLYAKRSEAYWAAGDADKALRDINQALMLAPEDAQAFLLRGRLLAEKGEHNKAIDACKRAEELGVSGFLLNYLLADLYLAQGQSEEASPYVVKTMALAPASQLVRLLRGRQGLAQADSALAAEQLTAAQRTDPQLSLPYELLYQLFDSLGHDQEAENWLGRGLGQVNDSLPLAEILVERLGRSGQTDSAMHWKARLAGLKTLAWEDYAALSAWQESKQQFDEAIYWLEKGLGQYPDQAGSFNKLGLLYEYRSIDLRKANLAYEQAVSLAPENPVFVRNLARSERKLPVHTD